MPERLRTSQGVPPARLGRWSAPEIRQAGGERLPFITAAVIQPQSIPADPALAWLHLLAEMGLPVLPFVVEQHHRPRALREFGGHLDAPGREPAAGTFLKRLQPLRVPQPQNACEQHGGGSRCQAQLIPHGQLVHNVHQSSAEHENTIGHRRLIG